MVIDEIDLKEKKEIRAIESRFEEVEELSFEEELKNLIEKLEEIEEEEYKS